MPSTIAAITPTATAMPIVELEIAPEESVGIVTGRGGGCVVKTVFESILIDEVVVNSNTELSEYVIVVADSAINLTVEEAAVLDGATVSCPLA